jgi:hypothetical protein
MTHCIAATRKSIPISTRLSCGRLSPFTTAPRRHPKRSASSFTISAQQQQDDDTPKPNTEFGYSRKDIIIIGGGLIGVGYASYYGLQAAGVEPGMAGNFVQAGIFLGICIGWVGSYLYRVATKKMTYVQQLKDYEDAVMKKRLEEIPDAEMDQLMGEIEAEKAALMERRQNKP